MKKVFSSCSIVLFTFGVLALIFGFINFSKASEAVPNQGVNRWADGGGAVINNFGEDAVNPTCTDNWRSWQNSDEFNPNAEWNLAKLPVPPVGWMNRDDDNYHTYFARDRVVSQFMDINGDGLQDYLYSFRLTDTPNNLKVNLMSDCVLLNTGHGWNVAYKCQTTTEGGSLRYFGDCALIR
ncbi:MAG: hypothetical protein NTV81_00580 [Candidatus Komeilibacteria bacterium]|nr:hypothetical protein [Candidatus Komeilibacteria bacterium]